MKLRIVEDARSFETDLTAPLELGRQQDKEGGPYTLLTGSGPSARLIIAWNPEDEHFSRRHLQLQPLPDGRVRITNLSSHFRVEIVENNLSLLPRGTADLTPPFSLRLNGRTLMVSAEEVDRSGLVRLAEQTLAPGGAAKRAPGLRALPPLHGFQLDQLVSWLQTTMGVLQSTVGASTFQDKAAEALVEIVGLHTGRVLRRHNGRWEVVVARDGGGSLPPWQPSDTVLDALLREKRTVWQRPRDSNVRAVSLEGMQTVVAAPLLDAGGEVIGALYGELRRVGETTGREAGKLQAVLVELLACGVSAGLARQRQEQEATRNQTLFEQFFTAPLAARLREHPDLLRGRTETVTVLFCDVRNSCAVSGRLGPELTERWLGDVLGELSRCVLAEHGVLVDYIGDALIAMWGAPTPDPEQTERAARAALAMLQTLTVLNDRWRGTLGEEMGLSIGLNRGPAQVGNIGSTYKFKYGPLGNTVNVASRTQGLTKYLKCRLLITAAVRAHLGAEFDTRRVCQARLVNIEQPENLYEVAAAAEGRADFFRGSEEALEALEKGQFALAGGQAGGLLARHPGDGPLLLILSRAADALMHDGQGFDPVWLPPGK
jgi:adenylate cyclase